MHNYYIISSVLSLCLFVCCCHSFEDEVDSELDDEEREMLSLQR